MRIRVVLYLSLVFIAAFGALRGSVSSTSPRFYHDDPIAQDPESQDASRAAFSEIGDLYEMTYNLFVQPGYAPSGLRAQNINTIDEVPV